MMFHTQEALVADSTLHEWQHVVEQILLLNPFLVQNHVLLLIMMLKDMAQKHLLLKHYGDAPPEKELSLLISALTTRSV